MCYRKCVNKSNFLFRSSKFFSSTCIGDKCNDSTSSKKSKRKTEQLQQEEPINAKNHRSKDKTTQRSVKSSTATKFVTETTTTTAKTTYDLKQPTKRPVFNQPIDKKSTWKTISRKSEVNSLKLPEYGDDILVYDLTDNDYIFTDTGMINVLGPGRKEEHGRKL